MIKQYYILLLILLFGCKSGINKIVEQYETDNNRIKIVRIIEEEDFYPFFAKDSIAILDSVYLDFYKTKIQSLKNQLNSTIIKYEQGKKELKTIENPIMSKVYNEQLLRIKNDIENIQDIIYTYKNYPEQTGLKIITDKKIIYQNSRDSILGYRKKIEFEGVQGKLPKTKFIKEYLFDRDKNKIIAVLK
jgi:hypothetical protein